MYSYFRRLAKDLEFFMKKQPNKSMGHYEVKTLSTLNFRLLVPLKVVKPYMHSFMKIIKIDDPDYLGEEDSYLRTN
jgi:hypothetical protein